MEGKKTKGKQKIELKLIENLEDKFVTFSKRRSGINKKASELATLTGAEIAFVVFSPAGKPYSFGHPSVESVVRRYLGQEEQGPKDGSEQIVEAHRQIKINDLNNYQNKLIQKLDADNKKMRELKVNIDAVNEERVEGWWETPIKDLSFGDLVNVNDAYKGTFAMLYAMIQEKNVGGTSNSSMHLNSNPKPPPLSYVGTDHLGIAQMLGSSFEVGSGSGGGGPSFEDPTKSRGEGPLFEVTARSGGGGSSLRDPFPNDVDHQ